MLFRQSTRLSPAGFPTTPNYPLTDVVTEDINLFDTSITVPYADTWTIGLQRSVGRDFAVEARYVGTRSRENWQTVNYNETNIYENGFINEFRVAQANLRANIAAGRGGTFAFTGAPGTAPLPTIFAFFHGTTGSANNAASYTSANFTNNTFLNSLPTFNPAPLTFANNLMSDAGRRSERHRRRNRLELLLRQSRSAGRRRSDDERRAARTITACSSNFAAATRRACSSRSSYAYGQTMQSNFLSFRRPI